MRRIGYILILLAMYNAGKAQEEVLDNRLKFKTTLDLHSSHLWRGLKNGNTFSVQPAILASKGGLNIGAWAAYAGNDSYFEVDLFVEYSCKSITFSLYDYYCPKTTRMNSFFEFRKFHTRHTLDAMLTWCPEKIPFKVMLSTFILGDDISQVDGRQAYSTYIEPALTLVTKRFSADLFSGFTPFKGYYASNAAFINIGTSVSYKLKIRDYSLPIQSKFSYNPVLKVYNYSIGFSLEFNY